MACMELAVTPGPWWPHPVPESSSYSCWTHTARIPCTGIEVAEDVHCTGGRGVRLVPQGRPPVNRMRVCASSSAVLGGHHWALAPLHHGPGAHSTRALYSWTPPIADPARVSHALPGVLRASEAGQGGTQGVPSRLSPGTHEATSLSPLFPRFYHLTSPEAATASRSGLNERKPMWWARKINY